MVQGRCWESSWAGHEGADSGTRLSSSSSKQQKKKAMKSLQVINNMVTLLFNFHPLASLARQRQGSAAK
jgi:hypothetical protein